MKSGFIPEFLVLHSEADISLFAVESEKIRIANSQDFSKISALKHPSGSLGVFKLPKNKSRIPNDRWILAADFIQDPGNLGTLIRIADWFGITHIVCSENTVDAYNPKVVQATMGSLARVRVEYRSLPEWIKDSGQKVYAGTLDGKDIRKVDFSEPGILLIGNEGSGISEELLPLVTESVFIPKFGQAESLNASVAAGIISAFVFLKH